MDLKLKGKVAIITGGSKGIGYEIAEAFLQEGARVAICSRNQSSLEEAGRYLSRKGEVIWFSCDATKPNDLHGFAKKVYEHYGAIDCWVNNVGAAPPRSGTWYSEADVAEVVALCFNSVVFGCQTAGSYMKNNPDGGSIVNISSLAARVPTAGRSTLYGPLKAAVRNLSVTFGAEFAAWNIRVNSVLPGFTDTDALTVIPEEELSRIRDRTLIGRMGKPEEIARPVVFLCSDAASYITATSLEVSGGRDVVLNPEISKT